MRIGGIQTQGLLLQVTRHQLPGEGAAGSQYCGGHARPFRQKSLRLLVHVEGDVGMTRASVMTAKEAHTFLQQFLEGLIIRDAQIRRTGKIQPLHASFAQRTTGYQR